MTVEGRRRIAVVGAGVAGLTAAYLLHREHDVTLFEKENRLGGHAHTHAVPTPDGRILGLDSGFIVHNNATYPQLLRLFAELGVATQDSTMSFGVSCQECGLEYSGARGLALLAPRVRSGGRVAYARMVFDIARFHRHGQSFLRSNPAPTVPMGEFLDDGKYSQYFRDHFILPLSAAVWSSSPRQMLAFPAQYLLRFFANHGLLGVRSTPQWKTVVGGSQSYVAKIGALLGPGVMVGAENLTLSRDRDGVTVLTADGDERRFDDVVIATHPDQALALLTDPTEDESRVLGQFQYSTNQTVLHTDESLLPETTRARSSWNYLLDRCATEQGEVRATYSLNRLQMLHEPLEYCVTLNQTDRIDPAKALAHMTYEHPIYTAETLSAQRALPALNGINHTVFAGAYQGWGFHEDGCASGVRAAAALGVSW